MSDTPVYPTRRPRRLRLNKNLRRLTRETSLSPADFIYPLFIRPGKGVKQPISSMPGQYQWSVDKLAAEAETIAGFGIPAVILFGIPESKDALGSGNYDAKGIVPQAIRAIKDATPELVVISDMCFCEYTDHGTLWDYQHPRPGSLQSEPA
jgi:porphobilinogen synthase